MFEWLTELDRHPGCSRVLLIGHGRIVLPVGDVESATISDDVQLSGRTPWGQRVTPYDSALQRMSCEITHRLLSLDIVDELGRSPQLIGDYCHADVGRNAKKRKRCNSRHRGDAHLAPPALQTSKDVGQTHRTGQYEEWNEVTEISRTDVAPQHQRSSRAGCGQKQEPGPCHLPDRPRSEGCHQAPDAQEE